MHSMGNAGESNVASIFAFLSTTWNAAPGWRSGNGIMGEGGVVRARR